MQLKTKRMELPDLLRGLAIIFMVLVHVMNIYGDLNASSGAKHAIVDFLGGPPAAPVFMVVMGFFFMYKKTSLQKSIKRGVGLLLTGYLLNFLRGYLPLALSIDMLGYPPDYYPELYSKYYMLWTVDILIFAGLAFIAMGFLRKISEHPLFLAAVVVLTAMLSPYLWGIGANVPIVKHPHQPILGC